MSKTRLPKKKKPILAAVLSFVFGPLGFFYIGWRYAVCALFIMAVFLTVLAVVDYPYPHWMQYLVVAVMAWKAYTVVEVRNALIEAKENGQVQFLDSFRCASLAMSDLLVGIGQFYAGAAGLYIAARLFLDGKVFGGLFMLVLGTGGLVWIAGTVFMFLAIAIDAASAALFGRSENIFTHKNSSL